MNLPLHLTAGHFVICQGQKGPVAWPTGALSHLAVVSMALNQVTAQSEERTSHLLFHALLFSLRLHL